jgi:hypothetical protein
MNYYSVSGFFLHELAFEFDLDSLQGYIEIRISFLHQFVEEGREMVRCLLGFKTTLEGDMTFWLFTGHQLVIFFVDQPYCFMLLFIWEEILSICIC